MFIPNYSKKQYQRIYSDIKIEHKGNSSHRDHLIRKIKTSEEYDNAYNYLDQIQPEGLLTNKITNSELLDLANSQVISIASNFEDKDVLTNYRFYIGTAYFDRNSNDDFPLYRLDDPKVFAITDLVFQSLNIFGINDYDRDLLNIIVRIYRPGDILNFHSDREIFGENIYGIILQNIDLSRGLMLKNKKSSYILNEELGTIWCLTGKSRWDYEHGYSATTSYIENNYVRISITFRFFEKKEQIPKKDYQLF